MSKIKAKHVFTSESVSEGHPDKVCDQISDAIVDACIDSDPNSRVACECLATTGFLCIAGEITTNSNVDFESIARGVVRQIGYNDKSVGFDADSCEVMVRVHEQSQNIAQGVNEGEGLFKEQGAGDQGMMFGYASDETPQLMPAPILYAHRLVERLAELRHNEPETYAYLRPDSKSQVSVAYDDGHPLAVKTIVVSHQHTPDAQIAVLEKLVRDVTHEVIPAELLHNEIEYYVNPTGRFEIGGPHGDCGLTGRKIIVDTYGGVGCHGGGAFSGKDPSKVDRSAAYMCRYIAKNVVAAGLASKCEVQVAYAIGVSHPLSINVETFGTGKVSDQKLQSILEAHEIFDLRPAMIIHHLGLKQPRVNGWSYQKSASYGHFGRDLFPWEKTDKVDALKAAANRAD